MQKKKHEAYLFAPEGWFTCYHGTQPLECSVEKALENTVYTTTWRKHKDASERSTTLPSL